MSEAGPSTVPAIGIPLHQCRLPGPTTSAEGPKAAAVVVNNALYARHSGGLIRNGTCRVAPEIHIMPSILQPWRGICRPTFAADGRHQQIRLPGHFNLGSHPRTVFASPASRLLRWLVDVAATQEIISDLANLYDSGRHIPLWRQANVARSRLPDAVSDIVGAACRNRQGRE